MGGGGPLARRVATAVPGIGLFVAVALIDSRVLTAVFFAAAAALVSVEAVRLLGRAKRLRLEITGALLTGGAAAAVALLRPEMSIVLLFIPGAVVSLITVIADGPAEAARKAFGTAFVLTAAAVGFGLLARLRIDFDSGWVMFLPLLICWAGDTLAYFAGSAFGRHRMAPSVSPAKSWEGFAAGMAGSVLGALAAGSAGAGFPALSMVAAGVVGGVAAVAGDLLESALKRDAGVKDSGSLLPGHGGFLDRFDSVIAVVPVVWAMLLLFEGAGML